MRIAPTLCAIGVVILFILILAAGGMIDADLIEKGLMRR